MSQVTVWIPPALREFVKDAQELTVEADDVSSALAAIGRDHAGFSSRVLSPDGGLRPLVNIFVDEDNIRELRGLDTPLSQGQTVSIIPAIAGG